MKSELRENMYVRLQNDVENIVIINKIANVFETTILTENDGSIYQGEYTKENVVKASYSIIDILEVGDYVNGSEVLDFEYKVIKGTDNFTNFAVVTENCYLENTDSWIIEKNIKSIVTKEQMEQMAYKVGE